MRVWMELFVPRVFAVFRTNVSKIKKRGQKKKEETDQGEAV